MIIRFCRVFNRRLVGEMRGYLGVTGKLRAEKPRRWRGQAG